MRLLLVLLFSVAVLGCNKGKRVLEEANRLASEGELDRALSELKTLKDVAPGTAEEAEGRRLAVEWLMTEATSKVASPENALQKVRAARSWQAENPQAAELECRLLHKLDRPDDFLACFETLPGSVPEENRKKLRDFANGIRRTRLRKSTDLKDWLALIQEFPASDEAEEVRETIAEKYSLCGMKESKDSLENLIFATDHLSSTWNEYVTKAFDQDNDFARNAKLEKGVERVSRAAELAAERHAASKKRILEQPAFLNEDNVRSDLLALYSALEITAKRWLRLRSVQYAHQIAPTVRGIGAAHKVDAEKVVQLNNRMLETCSKLIGKTDWKVEVARALGETAPSADDLPSALSSWLSAQNSGDFDAYAQLYAADFQGVKNVGGTKKHFDRQGWLNDRKGMFANSFSVKASDAKVDEKDGTQVITFTQTWKSSNYGDRGTKVLHVRDGKVVREEQVTSAPLGASSIGPFSVAEWDSAEMVNTQGASSRPAGCDMRVKGDWVRVVCSGVLGHEQASNLGTKGEDYFLDIESRGKATLVVKMRQGPQQTVRLCRKDERASLLVSWPSAKPRPVHIALGKGPACDGSDWGAKN